MLGLQCFHLYIVQEKLEVSLCFFEVQLDLRAVQEHKELLHV